MEPSTYIAIYMPMFILLFVIIPASNRQRVLNLIIRKRKGINKMAHELLKEYVGKYCNVSTGSYGKTFKGVKIVEVVDSWMKIEKNGKVDLINADYIQTIKVL